MFTWKPLEQPAMMFRFLDLFLYFSFLSLISHLTRA